MAELCGWTREVDWGNAPSWVAALTAVIVAAFTLVNVQTARRAYVRGVQTDEVATARLVWSAITKSGTIEKGGPIPTLPGVDAHHMWSSQVTSAPGHVARVNQRSVFVVVEVTNNSSEPIGDIDTVVYEYSGRPVVEHSNRLTVLRPSSTRTTFYLAQAREGYVWSVMHSSIRFHDSAGLVWRRTDTTPPERDENKVATHAYEREQVEKLERAEKRDAEDKAKRRKAVQAKQARAPETGDAEAE